MLQPCAACLIARARCVRALRVDLAGPIRDNHPTTFDEAWPPGPSVIPMVSPHVAAAFLALPLPRALSRYGEQRRPSAQVVMPSVTWTAIWPSWPRSKRWRSAGSFRFEASTFARPFSRVGRLLVIVVLAAVWDVVVRGSWDQATRMELAHICFDEAEPVVADLDGGLDGALLGDQGGLVHLDAHALRPLAHGGV